MAAGTFTLYNGFKEKLMKAEVDLNGDTFKVALLDSNYTPAVTTDDVWADISADEISDGDYAQATLGSVTVVESAGTVTFDAADVDYGDTVTITAKYAVIYDDTHATDALVGYVDLDSGGGSVSSTSSDFDIAWNASGIFTLS